MELLLFAAGVGMFVTVIVLLRSQRRTLQNIELEQKLLSTKIDYLRRELGRPGAGEPRVPEVVETRAPVMTPPPLPRVTLPTVSAPVFTAAPVQSAPPVAMPMPSVLAQGMPSGLPASAKEGDHFVEEILRRMWNWIIVGEEERERLGVTREYALATRWLMVSGIVGIVLTAAFFLTWSIQKDYLPEWGRVALCVATGTGLLVWGWKLLAKKYQAIGQGLIGGAILILYFSGYAMGPLYAIFGRNSITAAFVAMIAVTIAAVSIAVRIDSLLVAVFGLIGGFLTPVLLKAETPNLPVFYSYLLLLNLGILAVAQMKSWRLLCYLGFLFTYGMFAWMLPCARVDFPMTMAFLAAYFVIHSSLVYVNNIAREQLSTTLDVLHMVANAIVFAGLGYRLIHQFYPRTAVAILSIGMTLFYGAHAVVFLRKGLLDRRLILALTGISALFATWTLPLLMAKESLPVGLSLLAFLFLWLGRKTGSNFIQQLALAVYFIVLLLGSNGMGRDFLFAGQADGGMEAYWPQMFERLWRFGVPVVSFAAAFFLLLKEVKPRTEYLFTEENDIDPLVPLPMVSAVLYWVALAFGFLFLHGELNVMFGYVREFRPPVLTLLWCGLILYLLWSWVSAWRRDAVTLGAMGILAVLVVVKVLAVDTCEWRLAGTVFMADYDLLSVSLRVMNYGMVIALLTGIWASLWRKKGQASLAKVLGYTALGLLFVYSTLEVNSLLHWKLAGFQAGGISVLWALFSIAFVVAGIRYEIKTLRYLGLGLFVLVVVKAGFFDFRTMGVQYRMIASLVGGLAFLGGAFAYTSSVKKFARINSD